MKAQRVNIIASPSSNNKRSAPSSQSSKKKKSAYLNPSIENVLSPCESSIALSSLATKQPSLESFGTTSSKVAASASSKPVATTSKTIATVDESSEEMSSEEPIHKKIAKSKGIEVLTAIEPWYKSSNAYSYFFFTRKQEKIMEVYENRGFLVERNINLPSFKSLGVIKIVEDNMWLKTMYDFKGFVPRIVQEFYANLTPNLDDEKSDAFRKVYVRGHVYYFSAKIIGDFLQIPVYDFDDFEKEYDMDCVASELLGENSKWPVANTLKVSDLTLKYSGLHKIAISNWWPTAHYSTVSRNFACFLFDIGTGIKVNLAQIMYENITMLMTGQKKSQKLPFPCLIYGILQNQKPLIRDNEYISGALPRVTYRFKAKGQNIEDEEEPLVSDVAAKLGTSKHSVSASSSPVPTKEGTIFASEAAPSEFQLPKVDHTEQKTWLEIVEKTQQEILAQLTSLLPVGPSATTIAPLHATPVIVPADATALSSTVLTPISSTKFRKTKD